MKRVLSLIVVCFLLCAPLAVNAESTFNETPTETLSEGAKQYTLDPTYEYNVYYFYPSEIGEYTITSENSVLGIASYTDMWIMFEPSAETVTENTINWSCTDTHQSIMIAVKGEGTADITITRKDIISNELPWITYENKFTTVKFKFNGDTTALMYTDTFDGIEDSAVIGADGRYHLNASDGPVLYVNLNDELMSLVDKDGYAVPLKSVKYEDGNVVEQVEYNTAFEEYRKHAHRIDDYLLYPLTEDLISLYQNVGEANDWYGEDGWVGGEESDAWMFACYYDEAIVEDYFDKSVNEPSVEPSDEPSEETPSEAESSDESSAEPSDSEPSDSPYEEPSDKPVEESSVESSEGETSESVPSVDEPSRDETSLESSIDSSVESSEDETEETPSESAPSEYPPEKPSSPSEAPSTPKTGDASALIVFAILAVMAILGSATVIKTRR